MSLEQDIIAGRTCPVKTLNSCLETGEAAFDIIWVCLRSYQDTCLRNLPRRDRLARIRADMIGGRVLGWLRGEKKLLARLFSREHVFLKDLCYYLVAEGTQDNMLDLLKMDPPPARRLPSDWRAIVTRNLVLGHLHTKINYSADAALDLLFRVMEEIPAVASQPLSHGAKGHSLYSPAIVELIEAVTTQKTCPVSLQKFQRFLEISCKYPGPKHFRWQVACLSLYIPDAPDPEPLLSYLKDSHLALEKGKRVGLLHDGLRYVYTTLYELEKVLRRMERWDDVAWVRVAILSAVRKITLDPQKARRE